MLLQTKDKQRAVSVRSAAASRSAKWLFLCCVCLLASACGTPDVSAQFRAYTTALTELNQAGDALLQTAAVNERRRGREKFQKDAGQSGLGVVQTFDPTFASYYATNGAPPLTASYRRLLGLTVSYNEALLALAEGRALDDLQRQAADLAGEVALAASAVSGAPVSPALSAALAALGPIFERIKSAISRAAFRDAFLEGAPLMDKVFQELETGSAELFRVLVFTNERQLLDARLDGNKEALVSLRSQHESYRAALSDWIEMIRQAHRLMREVTAALRARPSASAVLADLTGDVAAIRISSASLKAAMTRAQEAP